MRSRRAEPEEILESKVEELWVCREEGRLFADQSVTPKVPATKKKFRVTKYLPMRMAKDAPLLWKDLRFPRLSSAGNAVLYDGSRFQSPYQVLEYLNRIGIEREEPRYELTRIERVDQAVRDARTESPSMPGAGVVSKYEKELEARHKEYARSNPPMQIIGTHGTSNRAMPRAAAPTQLVDIGPDRSARRADRSVEKESPSLIDLVEDQIGSSLKPYRDGLKDSLT